MRLKIRRGLPWGLAFLLGLASVIWLALEVTAHRLHKPGPATGGSRIQTKVTPQRVSRGRAVFKANCARCHRADSTRWLVGPGLKGLFKRKVTPVFRHPVTEWTIRGHIRHGSRRMPPFRHLKGRDMNSLIAFLKTI